MADMSTVIFPRSPRETMAGWVYLPRFVDKVRLHLAGKLPADYAGNFANAGFDAHWCKTAGVKAEDFIAFVKGTVTDGQVTDWVVKNVNSRISPAQREEFNSYVLNRGREDDQSLRDRLKSRKAEAGLAHRDDIDTFVDFIDADEKRI